MKPAETLRKALEVLKTDGWVQDTYHCDEGGHCAYGAILSVTDGYDDLVAALKPLRDAIGNWNVEWWNDNDERAFAEVEAVFLRAIEIAEARS